MLVFEEAMVTVGCHVFVLVAGLMGPLTNPVTGKQVQNKDKHAL
jgi:hypothetical protein